MSFEQRLNVFCPHGKAGALDCTQCAELEMILQGTKQTKITKAKNRQENLCDTCTQNIPECHPDLGVVEYGKGRGRDNIIACDVYVPRAKPIRLEAEVLIKKIYHTSPACSQSIVVDKIVEVFTEAINEDFALLEKKIDDLQELLEAHDREDGHGL